jgi:hypothetical protein
MALSRFLTQSQLTSSTASMDVYCGYSTHAAAASAWGRGGGFVWVGCVRRWETSKKRRRGQPSAPAVARQRDRQGAATQGQSQSAGLLSSERALTCARARVVMVLMWGVRTRPREDEPK